MYNTFNNGNHVYHLVESGLIASWWTPNFNLKYKDKIIYSAKTNSEQQVCDFLNKFSALSKEEIEKMYQDGLHQTKSELEKEIESLQKEKADLEEEVKIIRQIRQKRKELDEWLEKLEKKND